jgi:glyoxylase-like metal-dependent hydrolase (beta-lactamase superfamily II)
MADAVTRSAARSAAGLHIHCLLLGPLDNLVYVIEDTASRRAAVIDPAWETEAIIRLLEQRGLEATSILLTHGHDDHVNGLEQLLSRFPALVHVTRAEAGFWRAAAAGSVDIQPPPGRTCEIWATPPPPSPRLHDGGGFIQLGETRVGIISTPGHSPGGACYSIEGHLFTGDTLFLYGCGRCDLPGSDARQMYRSLQWLKHRVADEVIVHPGHKYAREWTTSMGEQRRGNPFLHINGEDAFVAFRAEHNRHRRPPYRPVPRGVPVW